MTSPPPVPRLLYRVPDAAYQLGGLSARHVKRLVASGALRPTRIGKRVFIAHTTLVEFIARQTEESRP